MRSLLIGFAVLALIACKKDPPVEDPGDLGMGSGSGSGSDAPPPDDGVPQDLVDAMDGYVGALESVGEAAAGAAADCAAMAEALKTSGEAGKPAMKEFEGFPGETVEEHMTALNARFGERIDAALILIGESTEVCEDDPAVLEQLQRMGFSG